MTRCPECGTILTDGWPIIFNDCCVEYLASSGKEAPPYEEIDFSDPYIYDDFGEEWDDDEYGC